jgi:uncharacterized membrane protein YeaQ/YmgE (transglycosylase-associated protein family)
MYEYPRRSIRTRALRIARQRGWIGEGGKGMAVAILLLVVAAFVTLWAAFAITGFVFSLLPMAIIGLLTGWVASRLTGARLGLGWTLLTGLAGSWLGGAIFSGLLNLPASGFFNPLQWAASILGATVLIVFARAVARPSLTGAPRPRLGRM